MRCDSAEGLHDPTEGVDKAHIKMKGIKMNRLMRELIYHLINVSPKLEAVWMLNVCKQSSFFCRKLLKDCHANDAPLMP